MVGVCSAHFRQAARTAIRQGVSPQGLDRLVQLDRRFGESFYHSTNSCARLYNLLIKAFTDNEYCVQVILDNSHVVRFLVLNRTTNLAVQGIISSGYLYNSYNITKVSDYDDVEPSAFLAPSEPVLLSTVWIDKVADMVQRSFVCLMPDHVTLGVPLHVHHWRRNTMDRLVARHSVRRH